MKNFNTCIKLIFCLLVTASLTVTGLQAQNLTVTGQLAYPERLSDIWGYEDASGHEYAIVGSLTATSIVDVSTDPSAPTELFSISGPSSIWRDMKVWGDHAYIIHDFDGFTGVGLLIIDMTNLPASIDTVTIRDFGGGVYFETAHNIFIDENGFAYVVGADYAGGGALILDLNTDPMNPTVAGVYTTAYIHDIFVRGDTMWTAEINDGRFAVVDVSDKSNPVVLATQNTPSNFCHNLWLTDDGQYLFTTDEVVGGYIGAYDVSDLGDIEEVDRWQSSPGSGVIPHNSFVLGDYVITSYYTDGVIINDVSNPDIMVKVGGYDTSPLFSGAGFNGCWGVYPYASSGLIFAADIQEGLYILDPNYTSAGYLVGTVTDAVSTTPVFGVSIEIVSTDGVTTSDIAGEYGTGVATTGTYDVTYSKIGYYSKTESGVTITAGSTTTLDVTLDPIPSFSLNLQVLDSDGNAVPDAEVSLVSTAIGTDIEVNTDASGNATVNDFFEGTYEVIGGKWGYLQTGLSGEELNSTSGTLTITLEDGIEDNFAVDLGWLTVGGGAIGAGDNGKFVRGVPVATNFGTPITFNPGADVTEDLGEKCYMTGNQEENDFIWGGTTTMISPEFDPRNLGEATLSLSTWFVSVDAVSLAPREDIFILSIISGSESAVLDTIMGGDPITTQWVDREYVLEDYIALAAGMKFKAEVQSEFDPTFSDIRLAEAAVDNFRVFDGTISSIEEPVSVEVSLTPNPADEYITLQLANDASLKGKNLTLDVYDIAGSKQIAWTGKAYAGQIVLETMTLNEGIYLYELTDGQSRLTTGKFVVNH